MAAGDTTAMPSTEQGDKDSMHDRDDDSTNAFAPQFFEYLARRDFHPATPEADHAGPWRVVKLHGDGPPLYACYALGERAPRLTFEAPDLAYLAAATLHVTDRPHRFRWQREAPGDGQPRLHLLHDGQPVATARRQGDSLTQDLTRLADLRVQPLALAQFLLAIPDEVLRRTGEILMDMLRKAER
jgi:hypothetical protein